jgi:hypothetical protein
MDVRRKAGRARGLKGGASPSNCSGRYRRHGGSSKYTAIHTRAARHLSTAPPLTFSTADSNRRRQGHRRETVIEKKSTAPMACGTDSPVMHRKHATIIGRCA